MKQLISTIQHYDKHVDEIQEQIDEITIQTVSPIVSITGIRHRLGAIIFAEIKNIDNFSSPAYLQAFAGLEPSIYQSGRMMKRGSPYLHYVLILSAQSI